MATECQWTKNGLACGEAFERMGAALGHGYTHCPVGSLHTSTRDTRFEEASMNLSSNHMHALTLQAQLDPSKEICNI